ncbi:MAG: glucose-1-phosphate adenylyltransferase [Ruminococcaceae bacterium]|nr:glucose-1-phosphate adenylyltransferase [Oscillospiraceae bacterium]
MYKKKECVVMLLAGGQGSRLHELTEKTAKPSVSFGGKYKIIDFPLSNCTNSNLDTVGVLTQYQPLYLNDYIGTGLPWDLDRTFGGVKILPPYQRQTGSDWYKGTANAIWQNMEFIRRYNPEYVLILSGDHIYKMDYSKMISFHKKKKANCTIAVIDVPLEEASRFGIMSADEEGKIYKFTEKPKNPDSTKASMGIYVFDRETLERYLESDARDPESSNDFGKDVIPAMLKGGEKLYAYQFEGYWRDVGTIDSLWSANMDLLGEKPLFDLQNETSRIYSRQYSSTPQFIGDSAKIVNSTITAGCEILGTVENSVIGHEVKIREGAVVKNSVIMDNVIIKEGALVDYAIVDSDVTIGKGAMVGKGGGPENITVVGANTIIKEKEVWGDRK